MNKLLKLLLLLTAALSASAADRVVIDLQRGWKFQLGNPADAAAPTLDDAGWRTVNLPHDFQIEQPWVAPAADEKADNTDAAANIKSRLSSRGFKEMGCGWYRLHFTPDEALRQKRVLIDFGGIMYVGDVYLNGQLVGQTDYGYVGFEVDVTGKLRFGEDNVLAVMADTRQPNNSRWYTGGGLFRSVRLVATDREVYFERHPLRVTTRDNRFVSITAEATTKGRDKKMPLRIDIIDEQGDTVVSRQAQIVRATPSRTIEQTIDEIEIPNPKLWDIDTPHLYTLVATLCRENGTPCDVATTRFGLRTVEIGPEFGLKLNGRKVLLKGYANHHTLGALGAAAYPRAIEKRLRLMKDYGINHVRTSHNPYSREFIELCDELGLLVVDELYDKWTRQHTGGRQPFETLWQKDVPEWIKRDRNSPSVVMWSLGNELQQDPNQPYNDYGVTMYRLMSTLLHRYDDTRRVTVAMHPRYRDWTTDSLPCELARITDVQSYNYRYMYFPGDGKRFPWMTFYQSEATMAAMGPNFYEMNLDRVIGCAYWGLIDYLGESQGWPTKGWAQGAFYIDLQPKPKAYLMKSIFQDKPVVHVAVMEKKGDQMWNGVQTGSDAMTDHWNRLDGQQLNLIVYTNAEEVELQLNGKSLGVKRNSSDPKQRNQIRWDKVAYERGRLVAIARNGGREVARHTLETTGDACRLQATADNASWKADGLDLQHVVVTAVDRKGRRVQTAAGNVKFTVEGDAQIVAVTNGNHESDELNVADARDLFCGTATVILRAGTKPSNIRLKAHCDGMRDVTLKLATH